MYCQNCGFELPEGTTVCPECRVSAVPPWFIPGGQHPVYFPVPYFNLRSTGAGILILLAAIVCLLFSIYVFFEWILYYVEYPEDVYDKNMLYIWVSIFIMSIGGFGFGLITAVLCFKRKEYNIALGCSLFVVAACVFMLFDLDYFPLFPMVALSLAIPGFFVLFSGKRDFELAESLSRPFFPPPPMPLPEQTPEDPEISQADKLIELKKMKDADAISEEEFEKKKQEILDRL